MSNGQAMDMSLSSSRKSKHRKVDLSGQVKNCNSFFSSLIYFSQEVKKTYDDNHCYNDARQTSRDPLWTCQHAVSLRAERAADLLILVQPFQQDLSNGPRQYLLALRGPDSSSNPMTGSSCMRHITPRAECMPCHPPPLRHTYAHVPERHTTNCASPIAPPPPPSPRYPPSGPPPSLPRARCPSDQPPPAQARPQAAEDRRPTQHHRRSRRPSPQCSASPSSVDCQPQPRRSRSSC